MGTEITGTGAGDLVEGVKYKVEADTAKRLVKQGWATIEDQPTTESEPTEEATSKKLKLSK